MKFTDGYWCVKKGITPLYAAEYSSHKVKNGELVIYAPGRHIADRGDCLNQGLLTIRLTSPAENIIKVSVTHFEGTVSRGPSAETVQCAPRVVIEEDENIISFQSGRTRAVVDKRPKSWGIRFLDGDRELTNTGFRNMAYMKSENNGRVYMVEQLALDVDEYIYGLGERFTPFVKNGQSVEMWNEDGGTASEITYKNIPFYLSNKGYGVLLDEEGDA